ncbi:MAG: M48 family metalloprotease [Saprospiraceae bacterium]
MSSSLYRLATFYFLFFASTLLAQDYDDFRASPYFPKDTGLLFETLRERREVSIAESPIAYDREAEEIFYQRHRDLIRSITHHEFIFHDSLQRYTEHLFNGLIQANGLAIDPLIFINRSYVPNAQSMGNGIFVINLGLFQHLTTEAELAYAFCHELAHEDLHHSDRALKYYMEISSILGHHKKKRRKRKEQKSEEEVKTVLYNLSRESRRDELEADSLAMLLLEQSIYAQSAAQTALYRLRDYHFFPLSDLDLPTYFKLDSFQFQEEWLAEEERMFGGSFGDNSASAKDRFFHPDSLASHPALAKRLEMVERLLSQRDDQNERVNPPNLWREQAGYEILESMLAEGFTAHALIIGLSLIQHDPDNTYLQAKIARSLMDTYYSIQHNDFDQAVPSPNYFAEMQARQVVRMLRKMRPKDLVSMAYFYLKDKVARSPHSSLLRSYLEESREIMKQINK